MKRFPSLGRNFTPQIFIVFLFLFATPVDAGSMAGEAPHTVHTNAAVDTLLLSAGNFSPDQMIRWGERLPDPSYNLPDNARCFRYTGIFLPEESENTNVDGYYARVLPDGRIRSYAEVTGASVPDAEPDAFRARAEARLYGGEEATAKEMQERFRSMVTFFDGYRELAQHTTVRNYPGVGQVTATTVFYQYRMTAILKMNIFASVHASWSLLRMHLQGERGGKTGESAHIIISIPPTET